MVVKEEGFTLIELVATLSISGVLAVMTMDIFNFPLQSYLLVNERALLLASAQEIEDQLRRDLKQSGVSSAKVSADGKQLTINRFISLHKLSGRREYNEQVNDRYHNQSKAKSQIASTIIYSCHSEESSTEILHLERSTQPVSLKDENAKSVATIRQRFSTSLASCRFVGQQRAGTGNGLFALRFEIQGQHQPSIPFFYQFASAVYL